jgi:hypothetical protein
LRREAPGEAAQTAPPDAYRLAIDKDHALSMLMSMQQTLGEVCNELKHVNNSLDGLSAKVDKLSHWQSRVLGGVAVIICLWAVFSIFHDDVHFGPTSEKGAVTPNPGSMQKAGAAAPAG